MTVSCPKGCVSARGVIVQKNDKELFSGDSSICQAGIFMGIAKNTESTAF